MQRAVFENPSARARLERAAAWLGARAEHDVTILGATALAANQLARMGLPSSGAAFGWKKATLGILATELAKPELVLLGLVPASAMALEGGRSRIVHEG